MGSHEPAYPKALDQKQLKRKRKIEKKQCIANKKPKTNLLENKKAQKTVKNPKKTNNSEKKT